MLQPIREFYSSGKTLPLSFRKKCLEKLMRDILRREDEILLALHRDLGKPPTEAYASELGYVLSEIRYTLKNMNRWMKRQKVKLS